MDPRLPVLCAVNLSEDNFSMEPVGEFLALRDFFLFKTLLGTGIWVGGRFGLLNTGEYSSSVGVEEPLLPADGMLDAGDTGRGIIEIFLLRFLHTFFHDTNTF